MDNLITITIDGKQYKAKEGEFILNIARANNIFIPAICYVTRCTPTLACRLCLVEIDGKQAYGCNAKAKDGMNILTTTPNIQKERTAIMQVYDVNHPLQCGVCDQSGECELQNYTLYMGIENQQFTIKDTKRDASNWGVMKYDAGLCIVCEKCVTICKDMIGSNALSTTPRGGEPLDKELKTTTPKDTYAMWNKLNKSLIGFNSDNCTDCGECISVCPVGALVSSDFQYKSNAWELTKIPASNPHSSDCSLIYYEIKSKSISQHEQIIYRVTNDSHYVSLSGSARFGYDFENRVIQKDKIAFNKAIEALNEADSLVFNSFITNEDALILQKLKEKLGLKLINDDAYAYKEFMNNFSKITGNNLYQASLKDIHDSNFLISIGSFLKSDHPSARYAFNNAISMNKGVGLYFHPIGDPIVEGFGKLGKTIQTIQYNPLSEISVLYFVLDQFGKDLPDELNKFLANLKETRVKTITETIKETIKEKVIDKETGEEKEISKIVAKQVSKEVEFEYTKLLDNINTDENLLDLISLTKDTKDKFSLIIGEDIITHPSSKILAQLCGMIERYTDFNILIIPTSTNTLGVSLICDLDKEVAGKTIGYNQKADFEFSSLGDGDLDMPALSQQYGTFTNIDKKVVPTNSALPYNGYDLKDIAKVFDIEVMDLTKNLPTKNGFKDIAFKELSNYFSNDQKEHRGYAIKSKTIKSKEFQIVDIATQEISETMIYRANPINQVNEFTQKAHELNDESGLYLSSDGLEKYNIQADDIVEVSANGYKIKLKVILDNQIKGDIGYISTFDKQIDTKKLFGSYRFNQAKILKV